jgi:flagellin-like protein
MKKGISPLLAVSILVGFVIVLAIILLNFFDVFSADRTDDIENQEKIERACGELSMLSFEFCTMGAAQVDGEIRNEGNLKVVDFESEFRFFNDTAGILKLDSSDITYIEPHGFAGFTAAGFGSGPGGGIPNYGRINELDGFLYFKNVTFEDETIVCPGIMEPIDYFSLEECS